MKDYLFVCGTLLPGYVPEEIAGEVRRLSRVGRAWVRGSLYDLGRYPGAILDASSRAKIHGQLFTLPDDPKVLQSLDEYEGFEPSEPQSCLFVREQATATLEDGRVFRCWIYVYNRDPGAAPLIEGGDYAKFKAAQTHLRASSK